MSNPPVAGKGRAFWLRQWWLPAVIAGSVLASTTTAMLKRDFSSGGVHGSSQHSENDPETGAADPETTDATELPWPDLSVGHEAAKSVEPPISAGSEPAFTLQGKSAPDEGATAHESSLPASESAVSTFYAFMETNALVPGLEMAAVRLMALTERAQDVDSDKWQLISLMADGQVHEVGIIGVYQLLLKFIHQGLELSETELGQAQSQLNIAWKILGYMGEFYHQTATAPPPVLHWLHWQLLILRGCSDELGELFSAQVEKEIADNGVIEMLRLRALAYLVTGDERAIFDYASLAGLQQPYGRPMRGRHVNIHITLLLKAHANKIESLLSFQNTIEARKQLNHMKQDIRRVAERPELNTTVVGNILLKLSNVVRRFEQRLAQTESIQSASTIGTLPASPWAIYTSPPVMVPVQTYTSIMSSSVSQPVVRASYPHSLYSPAGYWPLPAGYLSPGYPDSGKPAWQ